MQHKASPGFSIFTPGDLHTINLEHFLPSATHAPSACFSSCRMQAGLMRPRPRGRRPPTSWWGRLMGPPLWWRSWRPSWWAGACLTPLCAELHTQQRGVHTPLRKRRLLFLEAAWAARWGRALMTFMEAVMMSGLARLLFVLNYILSKEGSILRWGRGDCCEEAAK